MLITLPIQLAAAAAAALAASLDDVDRPEIRSITDWTEYELVLAEVDGEGGAWIATDDPEPVQFWR